MQPERSPYPSSWNVRRALDAYLQENGFTTQAYEEPWTEASFLGIRFKVPNTARHKWAIKMHDLHHVATGYGTDLVGEGEVSAWELRRGLSGLDAYVASIVVVATFVGMIRAPARTLAAFLASGAEQKSLFDRSVDYEALLEGTVAELRARLHVPERGQTEIPRELHAYAPRRV
ncbi:MAG: hypothetical protein ACXWUG_04870 [Polyangiales bacterium]